jgi:PAS domain S-box-containing protein
MAAAPRAEPAAKRELILIADDNADMRQYLKRMLDGRYEVHPVADGREALEFTYLLRPGLVLADVMMPRLDGFGLLRAIREDSTLASTPVILVSAQAGEESRVEGLHAGADDYLVKPFTARELLARVETHLKMANLRRETAEREERLRGEAELEREKLRASEARLAETSRLYREVQNREAKIRRLVEANVVGIVMWNLEGAITGANEAFLRMVQYDREDLASGRVRWTDLTPAEWCDRDERAIAELKASGVFRPFEKEYFRKDGRRVPILLGGALSEDSGNEGVAFILDLSEQKRAEAEIAALNERLMKVQEQERIRIAGELHDGVLQQITTLTLRLGAAKLTLPPDSEAKATIKDLQGEFVRVGAEIRHLSHELHPALTRTNSNVQLFVSDDGIGFEPRKKPEAA